MSKNTIQEKASILTNENIQGQYFQLVLSLPERISTLQPGQFVHVEIPNLKHRILRRPFSISDADLEKKQWTIVYKVVGEGTQQLSQQTPGTILDILGPNGNGFSPIPQDIPAVILGGGYGCAAIFFLAHNAKQKPTVLLGARDVEDILLAEKFKKLGCTVKISTDNGSLGTKGRITVLLEQYLKENPKCHIAACGPTPMLKAVGQMAEKAGLDAELSMEEKMCCGVGVCFGCVIKVKDATTPEGWSYTRTCEEGPVFPASKIYWE
ncbi:MAG: dihydroorotate dehydrogenase electron transfer subunit [Lentisphaeria bacterium]